MAEEIIAISKGFFLVMEVEGARIGKIYTMLLSKVLMLFHEKKLPWHRNFPKRNAVGMNYRL